MMLRILVLVLRMSGMSRALSMLRILVLVLVLVLVMVLGTLRYRLYRPMSSGHPRTRPRIQTP